MVLSIIFPFAFFRFHISKQWDLRAARRGQKRTEGSFSANSGSGIVSELCIGAIAGECGGVAEGFVGLPEKALLYAISTLEKSFNPSADRRFTLVFRAKMAEGFDFQTFQNCSAVQQQAADGFHLDFHFAAAPSPGFVRTTPPTENPVAGPDFSIGGVVQSWLRLNGAERFKNQTLQRVLH